MNLFKTSNSWAYLILRVTLGGVILPHGAQKVLGLFGGSGFQGTLAHFSSGMHIPMPITVLVMCGEFLGSIGLIVGLLSRVGAFGILCVMIGAIILVHWPNGFFMNWSGNQLGEGFEYHLLAVSMALVLIIYGGGKWSLDRWISARLEEKR